MFQKHNYVHCSTVYTKQQPRFSGLMRRTCTQQAWVQLQLVPRTK